MSRYLAVLAAVGLVAAGCQVMWVSAYDPVTDRGVTQLQRTIDGHLTRLEKLAAEPPGLESLVQDCDPAAFADSFREMQAELRALILRNEARDKNELTVRQLQALQPSLDALREQQQERYAPTDPERVVVRPGDRCMSRGQVEVNRQILEQHIRAILKLELAKRDFRKED